MRHLLYSMMLTSIRLLKASMISHLLVRNVLTSTSAAITCKFRGSGQTCVCANRIYVQSSVYADFASRLAQKVAAFKVGNGLDDKTYVLL